MHSQRALFTEMEQKPPEVEPPGFRHREQIVSEEEEAALAAGLEKLGLKPFEFHGFLGNRRAINFGLQYDFSSRSVQRADDMPFFLNDLLSRVASFAGREKGAFRQVGPVLAGMARLDEPVCVPDVEVTDTDDLLGAAGLSAERVADLRARKVVA